MDYMRYHNYKSLVYAEFVKTFGRFPHHVFDKDKKYHVKIMAYYKNKVHGDTDNVAKGINDAIFKKPLSDKYIAGSYDFDYDNQNPRVEITIEGVYEL